MEKSTRTVKDLTVGKPGRLIVAFAIPMILGNLFQQLYNFVDTMIVGHLLGLEALAGVGATGGINFLILGFCMGMCAGFAIPVAQRFGAKDERGLRKFVANALYLSVGFSIAITIIVALLCRNILEWMRTPDDIIEHSYAYIFVIFLGIPVTFLYNILAGIIRAIGDSKTPLYFLIFSTFINIGLDYLFIAAFGWGVSGAALATVISQLISGVLCMIVVVRKFPILHVSGDEWKVDKRCMGTLVGMGLPMGLQYSITAIGSVILQSNVNILGSTSVAAVTAASKVNMLFICVLDALGASMATYGGQNVGAKRVDRVKQGVKAAVLLGIGYSIFAFVTVIFVGKPLVNLFLEEPNPEMVKLAYQHSLVTMGALTLLVFVNVLRFLIQGVGYSTFAICAGVLEMIARTVAGLVFIPCIGFLGACVASPFAWLLADLFLVPAYFYVVKRVDKILNSEIND